MFCSCCQNSCCAQGWVTLLCRCWACIRWTYAKHPWKESDQYSHESSLNIVPHPLMHGVSSRHADWRVCLSQTALFSSQVLIKPHKPTQAHGHSQLLGQMWQFWDVWVLSHVWQPGTCVFVFHDSGLLNVGWFKVWLHMSWESSQRSFKEAPKKKKLLTWLV